MPSVPRSITLSEEIERKIQKIMKEENRTASNVIDTELRRHWRLM